MGILFQIADTTASLISNSSFNLIRDNTILRTGDEAILVDTSTSGDFSQNNEIAHNLVEDSNTIPTTDGSISTSCSYSGCFGATDGTNIHDKNRFAFLFSRARFATATR